MKEQQERTNNYIVFGLMMAISFCVMYGVMFLNADSIDHVMLSYTRTYMTILMICPMAITMLLFKWKMYTNKKANLAIIGVAIIVFASTLAMLRNQIPIKDIQYMKAMIPHHSSAIMVSQKATFEDPELKQLATDIIEAQKKEIAQMKRIIERLESE